MTRVVRAAVIRSLAIRAVAICVITLAASPAFAGDEPDTADGKAYFADGTAAFERGDYAAASRAFSAGYAHEKWSGFLFAWAQAERVAGNCTKAVELYSKFIWTKPPDEIRDHALGWITECKGTYIEPPKPSPDTSPKPNPARMEDALGVKRDEPRPRSQFHHKLAIGLAIGSIAASAISVRYYVHARDDFDVAKAATDYALVERARERGDGRLLVAQVTGGVALGLAAGAIVRFVVHRPPSNLEVTATPNSVGVRGRF